MARDKSRMGGMGLREMGGLKPKEETPAASSSQPLETTTPPPPETSSAPPVKAKSKPEEKLITVNIKIPRSQHEWLNDTARQVRDNNNTPVPAGDRVYPQHLIQVAIEHLQSSGVDWEKVRNAEELRKALNLIEP